MPATIIPFATRPMPVAMTPEQRDRALHAELRRARIRIAALEAALTAAAGSMAEQDRACRAERRSSTVAAFPVGPAAEPATQTGRHGALEPA